MKLKIGLFLLIATFIFCVNAHAGFVIGSGGGGAGGTPDPSDVVAALSASTMIRSVGNTTSAIFGHDYLTGTYTMTINGNIATFNGADNTLACFSSSSGTGKVGVGDIIVYTEGTAKAAVIRGLSVDATGAKAYVWEPHSSDTGAPYVDSTSVTSTTNNDTFHIYRAYTSLSTWEAGTENTGYSATITFDEGNIDLTNANVQMSFWVACYNDAADTTGVNISDWVTSSTYKLKLFTPTTSSPYSSAWVGYTQRHSGQWTDTTGYNLAVSGTSQLMIANTQYLTLEGLQFYANRSTAGAHQILGWTGTADTAAELDVGHSIFKFNNNINSNSIAIKINAKSGTQTGWVANIYNCLIYGTNSGYQIGIDNTQDQLTENVYSTTFVDLVNAILQTTTTATVNCYGSGASNCGGTCYAVDNLNDCLTTTPTFVGAPDYHLDAADTAWTGQATNRYGTAPDNLDIDGATRPAVGAWDIGCDEH